MFSAVEKWHASMGYFFADTAVFSPEEQQRAPLPHDHIFDLGNEDRVVPGILGRLQAAF